MNIINYFLALISAMAYGSDAIFGKLALNDMPFFIFIFMLSLIYLILGVILFLFNYDYIISYFANVKDYSTIGYSIFAIIFGTIIADILMWKSIQKSQTSQLPITIAIIHTAPVFALLFVTFYFKTYLNWKALFGFGLVVIGTIIMIFNSGDSIDIIG